MRIKPAVLFILLLAGPNLFAHCQDIVVTASGNQIALAPGVEYNPSGLTTEQLIGLFIQLMALNKPVRVAGATTAYNGFDLTGELISVRTTLQCGQYQHPAFQNADREFLAAHFKMASPANMAYLSWIQVIQIMPNAGLPDPVILDISMSPQHLSASILRAKDVAVSSALSSVPKPITLPSVPAANPTDGAGRFIPESTAEVIELVGEGDPAAAELIAELLYQGQRPVIQILYGWGLQGKAFAHYCREVGPDWKAIVGCVRSGINPAVFEQARQVQ